MIVFDLRCESGHVFEAWFRSGAAFDEQNDRGLIICPLCASSSVAKAVMSPAVSAKANSAAAVSPHKAKQALSALAKAQTKMLENSRWVGREFAEQARAIHDGDRPTETIHGQATMAEARALVDDGIKVAPLPLPVVPQRESN